MYQRRYQVGAAGWGLTAFCTLIGGVYFLPVLWIVLTAFKSTRDALTPTVSFTPTFDNFIHIFRRAYHQGGDVVDTHFGLFFTSAIGFQLASPLYI